MICERMFEVYPNHEWDFYLLIPVDMETVRLPNHRLSLRRDKETGRYQLYRHFYARKMIRCPEVVIFKGEDLHAEEVAFEGEFEEAVKFGNRETAKYGSIVKFDICEHTPPNVSRFCPNAAGMFRDGLRGVVWRSRKLRRPLRYRLARWLTHNRSPVGFA